MAGSGETSRTKAATVPPGFRFHPTDEELLSFYLRRKIDKRFDLDHVICEIDLNQLEPWELCGKINQNHTIVPL
jgi:hypothetical protein